MSDESRELLGHVLLPLANKEDAIRTASALAPYNPESVTALHVVEREEADPDAVPDKESNAIAEDIFEGVRTALPDINEQTVYSTHVIDAIFETAEAVDATAIAYQTRGEGRLMRLLSGDPSLTLVTESPLPVIALPRVDPEE